ncbi:MAG: lipoyl(octanoyl) transferase LipB [Cyclobacteriaceae bacterium]|nr:lipoyl(octanoyl) transferase LipB [Cyclobacteriaceae bacterium]
MNIILNKNIEFESLGLKDYQEAWDYQTELFEKTIGVKLQNRNKSDEEQVKTPNYILFCQHPHVYTLGKSGKQENLLIKDEELKEKEASFYKINRGGDITYHGPGQLVGYPILDLENFYTDIHKYLRMMEDVIIHVLAEFGLKGDRFDGFTGVWLDPKTPKARKICAMGVKTSRWVTMHGFALNVNTDLSYFSNIVPCGIDDKAVTSLEMELGGKVDIKHVEERVKYYFLKLFEGVEDIPIN